MQIAPPSVGRDGLGRMQRQLLEVAARERAAVFELALAARTEEDHAWCEVSGSGRGCLPTSAHLSSGSGAGA